MVNTRISTQILLAVALRIGLGIPIIALIDLLPALSCNDWQGWNAASARRNSA